MIIFRSCTPENYPQLLPKVAHPSVNEIGISLGSLWYACTVSTFQCLAGHDELQRHTFPCAFFLENRNLAPDAGTVHDSKRASASPLQMQKALPRLTQARTVCSNRYVRIEITSVHLFAETSPPCLGLVSPTSAPIAVDPPGAVM